MIVYIWYFIVNNKLTMKFSFTKILFVDTYFPFNYLRYVTS